MAKYTSGGDQVRANLRRIRAQCRTLVEDELFKAAENTRTMVVADIRIQKLPAGVKAKGGPGRRKHIPSPPGGPPNSDTGSLMDRYGTAMGRRGLMSFSLVVAGVRYARFLEFGTRRMLPRPHLLPRFREEVPKLRSRLVALWDRIARGNIR